MSNRTHKHLHKDSLCFKCDILMDDEASITKLPITNRGYGSIYDSSSFTVQLCHGCFKQEYVEWFNEVPTCERFTEVYRYEDQINELINSFLIENQEYVRNNAGFQIERQDWIDMESGSLTEEKYSLYGMHSSKIIESYKERFSTCHYPVNISFNDRKSVSVCAFGSEGYPNQVPSQRISVNCFDCEQFKTRTSSIVEMTKEQFFQCQEFILNKNGVESYKNAF